MRVCSRACTLKPSWQIALEKSRNTHVFNCNLHCRVLGCFFFFKSVNPFKYFIFVYTPPKRAAAQVQKVFSFHMWRGKKEDNFHVNHKPHTATKCCFFPLPLTFVLWRAELKGSSQKLIKGIKRWEIAEKPRCTTPTSPPVLLKYINIRDQCDTLVHFSLVRNAAVIFFTFLLFPRELWPVRCRVNQTPRPMWGRESWGGGLWRELESRGRSWAKQQSAFRWPTLRSAATFEMQEDADEILPPSSSGRGSGLHTPLRSWARQPHVGFEI